jgi:hypothetical protein
MHRKGETAMATYAEIQDHVRTHNGFVPKLCWIAHVLSDFGLTKRIAPNRANATARKHPCPPEKRPAIIAALHYFGIEGAVTRAEHLRRPF